MLIHINTCINDSAYITVYERVSLCMCRTFAQRSTFFMYVIMFPILEITTCWTSCFTQNFHFLIDFSEIFPFILNRVFPYIHFLNNIKPLLFSWRISLPFLPWSYVSRMCHCKRGFSFTQHIPCSTVKVQSNSICHLDYSTIKSDTLYVFCKLLLKPVCTLCSSAKVTVC